MYFKLEQYHFFLTEGEEYKIYVFESLESFSQIFVYIKWILSKLVDVFKHRIKSRNFFEPLSNALTVTNITISYCISHFNNKSVIVGEFLNTQLIS